MAGIYCGIDCGKDGFSAEIDAETGGYLRADRQPLIGRGVTKGDNFDTAQMVRTAKRWKEEGVLLVVVEELAPMGGKGTPQTHFFQGMSYALWKGILAALEIPFRTIKKGHLKKDLGIKTPAKIPRKPEPAPLKLKKPKRPAKKASDKAKAVWQSAQEKWEKTRAEYDAVHKAWTTADRQRLARWQGQVKQEAIKVCAEYFPGVDLRRNEKCTTVDDNKAESMLYALMASKLDPRHAGKNA